MIERRREGERSCCVFGPAVWGTVLQLFLASCAATPGSAGAVAGPEYPGPDARSFEPTQPVEDAGSGGAPREVDADDAGDAGPWRRVLSASSLSVSATPGMVELARSVANDEELARVTRATFSHAAPGELIFSRFPAVSRSSGTFVLPTLQEAVDRSRPTQAESASSFVIDFDAPAVQRVIQELDGRQSTPEELEGAVYRFIAEKTYTHPFDVASRVAESRAGDCTEHAVLLTALLRARGIPARVVFGAVVVVSVDQMFAAGHAWTEYFEGRRWRRLDAALHQEKQVPLRAANVPGEGRDVARAAPTGASDVQAPPGLRRLYIPRLVMRREGLGYARDLAPLSHGLLDLSLSESTP